MPEINILIPRAQHETMSRRERKKQETRWRIYDAAIKLIAKHGYDEVKIEQICATADVSNAAFFHHFSNKAALIGAYFDLVKAVIRNKLDEAGDTTSLEKLNIISHAVSDTTQDTASFTPQLLGAITTGDRELDMEHVDTGITGTLSQIIKEGQENGEFSRKWHPELVAVSLAASWIILPLAMKGTSFPATPHAELLELMLAGLTAT